MNMINCRNCGRQRPADEHIECPHCKSKICIFNKYFWPGECRVIWFWIVTITVVVIVLAVGLGIGYLYLNNEISSAQLPVFHSAASGLNEAFFYL